MERILITSGPTREYLDPVRYLTNGSSGRMGAALAEAVLARGHLPVIVSGPVSLKYPSGSEVWRVETTGEMFEETLRLFPSCAGIIGAAAPCDFLTVQFSREKIAKPLNGGLQTFAFAATPDILAAAGAIKREDQWSIVFALETDQTPARAMTKLQRKRGDYVILNAPESIGQEESVFRVFDSGGTLRLSFTGTKRDFAEKLLKIIW